MLSLTGKRWAIPDEEPITDIGMLMQQLSVGRSLGDSADHWCDPTIYPDSTKAAERITHAIGKQETIAIFGDYDCDGVTATAQMVRTLRRRGVDPIVRLPHRVHDGYGLKPSHVDEFHEQDVSLIITVDTGISAHEAIDHARSHAIDVIILDHHHARAVPHAYAILHPGLVAGLAEPHPSAAGVVFTFLHALEGETWEERNIDLSLAMMGTVADLVPLRGMNRRLVQEGLHALNHIQDGPLKLLVDHVSGGQPLTSTDVAFRIAPRINAAGRLADPVLALRALLEGGQLLKDLETLNVLRQEETHTMLLRAESELVRDADGQLPAFLSIASSTYQPGILGLLAGRLTERYGRPSMAVTIRGEECTASFRSTPNYNIIERITEHSSLLSTFGGHAQAAGATFTLDNLITLIQALEQDASSLIPEQDRAPVLTIDACIDERSISPMLNEQLQALQPYGQGNPEPLFLLQSAQLENARRVGADGKHLQATLGNTKVIGFGLGDLQHHSRQPLDLVCRVGIDTWNGRVTPQLFVQDMRTAVLAKVK